MPTRRRMTIALAAWLAAPAAQAGKQRYVLDMASSRIGFSFKLNGVQVKGEMPVARADLQIDTGNLAASSVDVLLDAGNARTGLVFATQAMKGPDILDTARHPQIRFVSRRIRLGAGGRISDGATITGGLTLRGVTRPVTLAAELYRLPGSAPRDLEVLDVRLSGRISRMDFGASGYAGLVADDVALDIRARIRAAN